MWQMFAAQTALSFLGASQEAKAAKAQYKAQKAWQEYRNKMTSLSNAVSQNAISTNEILSNAAYARQAVQLKRTAMSTEGKAEASAAAAGVKGRSVNQVITNIQRNAAMQERERQIALESSWLAFDQQRLNSAMSSAMQQDYSYIAKPNTSSYFLKALGSSLGSAAGQDMMGSWFGSSSSAVSTKVDSLSSITIDAMKGLV